MAVNIAPIVTSRLYVGRGWVRNRCIELFCVNIYPSVLVQQDTLMLSWSGLLGQGVV